MAWMDGLRPGFRKALVVQGWRARFLGIFPGADDGCPGEACYV